MTMHLMSCFLLIHFILMHWSIVDMDGSLFQCCFNVFVSWIAKKNIIHNFHPWPSYSYGYCVSGQCDRNNMTSTRKRHISDRHYVLWHYLFQSDRNLGGHILYQWHSQIHKFSRIILRVSLKKTLPVCLRMATHTRCPSCGRHKWYYWCSVFRFTEPSGPTGNIRSRVQSSSTGGVSYRSWLS